MALSQSSASILQRPIFILAAPRSGSTLLFETLSQCRDLWTIGSESHAVFESIPSLKPFVNGIDSNRLTAANADPVTAAQLRSNFLVKLRDRSGVAFSALRPPHVRLLDKLPKNALRVPFINAVFPDALFIFLYREPKENVSSIMEAWRSHRFVTYKALPDWEGGWSLLLPPAWQELRGAPLERIAAFQWAAANRCIVEDLAEIPAQRWTVISHHEVTGDTKNAIKRLCRFAGVGVDRHLLERISGALPASRYTVTAPAPEKWRKNEMQVNAVLPELEPVLHAIQQIAGRARRRAP